MDCDGVRALKFYFVRYYVLNWLYCKRPTIVLRAIKIKHHPR